MNTFQKIKSELQQTGTVLGGLLLVLFILLTVSGIVLSLFYDPSPESVYQSMVRIMGNSLLAFVRNFHFWAADLFLFVMFMHMTRVALTKPSGRPRRYAWWIGTGMLILIGAEMLLGTFLRGDEESLEAYSHFFIGTTGIVAKYMSLATIATDFFSQHSALFRFFILHAVVVPFTIMGLVVMHGLFAPTFRAILAPWKKISDAAIRGQLTPQPGFWQSPSVRKILWLALIAFGIIVLLALTLPAPLLSQPYGGLEVTKPPWWLLWVVALENWWGLTPIVIAPPVLFAIFAIIPFLTKDKPGADMGVYVYLTTIAIVIALGFYAAVAPQVAHTEMFIQQQQQGQALEQQQEQAMQH
ncbi:MAG: cytochrome b N-terminal domain-containing protein [bacterium]|nr:cytochrome b N-terminal domain-containing protein [bacterium]